MLYTIKVRFNNGHYFLRKYFEHDRNFQDVPKKEAMAHVVMPLPQPIFNLIR